MVRITEELIRKRAEHNECEIFSLEEISLHQQNLEKIEYLDKWCRELKILYLQNNLIPKIENVSRLKKLQYLNLALNNIERIENLEGCESLQKLDLTVNFVGELTSVENLVNNDLLEELYLTGNPCTEYPGYRYFVIATLPQLQKLDGEEITKSERIQALQNFEKIRAEILKKQNEHFEKRTKEREQAEIRRTKHAEKLANSEGFIDPEKDEFWKEKVPFTPESRIETHEYLQMQEKAREKQTGKSETKPTKKPPRLFSDDGRPYNINQAKIEFSLNEEEGLNGESLYLLDVSVYRYMDTSLIDCDVQTNYVRVTLKGKILQLALPEEVQPDKSKAERSQTTGHLLIKMPKAYQQIKAKETKPKVSKSSTDQIKSQTSNGKSTESIHVKHSTELLDCENSLSGDCIDWRHIVKTADTSTNPRKVVEPKRIRERPNSPNFIDQPDVPPLI